MNRLPFVNTAFDTSEATHMAVEVELQDVKQLLGRAYGGEADDEAIRAALLSAGAPDLIRDTRSEVDQDLLFLIGPAEEIDDDEAFDVLRDLDIE
ncbi:MAG: hypothetical protein GY811_19255 [Myxococcales bacterium]|nr:hypothetical protein [Myxococcales bacterium]